MQDKLLINGVKLRLGPEKLEEEGYPANALGKATWPLYVQHAQLATMATHNNVTNTLWTKLTTV